MNPKKIGQLIIIILVLVAGYFFYAQVFGATTVGKTSTPTGSLQTGLVGHWTFDGKDMVSNVADVSGQGNNGFLNGQTSTTTVSGKVGQALEFDGVNDYVNLSSLLPTIANDTEGTISFWARIKTDNETTNIPFSISTKNGFPYSSFSIIFDMQSLRDYVRVFLSVDGVTSWEFSTAVNSLDPYVGEWVNVTLVHTGTKQKLFLNGVKQSITYTSINDKTSWMNSLITSATYLADSVSVGNILLGGTLASSFNGDIDDVEVWNRKLTNDEVKQIYDSTRGNIANKTQTPAGSLQTGLTGYWAFDGPDVSGSTVLDKSGNGYDAISYYQAATQITTPVIIGKIGQGFFNLFGNNYLRTTNTSNLITASDGTISVWLNPANLASIRASEDISDGVVANSEYGGTSTNGYFGISQGNINGQDKIWVWNYSTTPSMDSIGVNYTVGEWVNITWVHTGGVLYAYKNGVLVGSTPSADTTIVNGVKIGLGEYNTTATYFDGKIDEVRIYNRALTATEIKQLYNLAAN